MGSTMTRMVSLHLGIIIIAAALLYFVHGARLNIEKTAGITFFIAIIIIKAVGFMAYSQTQHNFQLAYLAGAILFVIVCFLLNRIIDRLIQEGAPYSVRVDALCAICLWVSVYLASFEVTGQESIAQAGDVVIVMAVLFLTIAVIFYAILFKWLKSGNSMIVLSLVILLCSGVTILIAGPNVPWELYSVVFNLLLLSISAAYIYYSAAVQSKAMLNIAVAAFVLHVVTRYFDLFWDMLSGALLFIITGFVGLFGGYILEKNRKHLSAKIERSALTKNGRE
jgi:hypothetical protein